MELLARGVLVVVVILFLYVLTQVIVFREGVKSTDLAQAIVGLGLLAAAAFGLNQYAQLRRPYVSLVGVKAESNLAKPESLIKYPDGYQNRTDLPDDLKQLSGKSVSPKEILKSPPFIREDVEEILFDMTFKNTGPLGATDCDIKYAHVIDHKGKALKLLWDEAEQKPQENFEGVRPLADDIVFNPQQEQSFHFMIHRKHIAQGAVLFILCDVQYNSIRKPGGGEGPGKGLQDSKSV